MNKIPQFIRVRNSVREIHLGSRLCDLRTPGYLAFGSFGMRNRLCFRLACFTVLLECAWVEEVLVVVVYPPELVVHHPLNFTLILAMYRLPHATQQVLLLVKHNPLSSHVFFSHNTAGEFCEMFDVHGSFFRRACCPSGSQRYRRFLDFRIISVLLVLPCSLLTCALMHQSTTSFLFFCS